MGSKDTMRYSQSSQKPTSGHGIERHPQRRRVNDTTLILHLSNAHPASAHDRPARPGPPDRRRHHRCHHPRDSRTQAVHDKMGSYQAVHLQRAAHVRLPQTAGPGTSSSACSSSSSRFVKYDDVNAVDLSGTTALMHAISTKPYLDLEIAQMLLDAGADINPRNRYGETAADEIVKVRSLDSGTVDKAKQAMRWFAAHGGGCRYRRGRWSYGTVYVRAGRGIEGAVGCGGCGGLAGVEKSERGYKGSESW